MIASLAIVERSRGVSYGCNVRQTPQAGALVPGRRHHLAVQLRAGAHCASLGGRSASAARWGAEDAAHGHAGGARGWHSSVRWNRRRKRPEHVDVPRGAHRLRWAGQPFAASRPQDPVHIRRRLGGAAGRWHGGYLEAAPEPEMARRHSPKRGGLRLRHSDCSRPRASAAALRWRDPGE